MNLQATNSDFYDDNGSYLRSLVSDIDGFPHFVKTAHVMNGSEDSALYALVMHDNTGVYKKFPIFDAGNTWISSSYFDKNYAILPEEAQKVAAVRLKEACNYYEIPVISSIEKIANKANSNSITTNIIDITNKRAPSQKVKFANDSSVEYALVDQNGVGKYPLNSASAVKAADDYFNQYHASFSPRQRREYSVKVASVAESNGIPVCGKIQQYSGTKVSDNVLDQFNYRSYILKEEGAEEETLDLLQKVASIAHTIEPDILADTLERFDRKNGLNRYWGKDILDPYASVICKTAAGFSPNQATITVGTSTVTEHALNTLAKNKKILIEHFGHEFANSFQNNPVEIFQSMPTPQKKILINMANDSVGNA